MPEAANKAIQAEVEQDRSGGKGVKFKTSYGASGDQSRAVVAGLEGRLRALLGRASDVTRLVDAGLVAEDWDDGPNKGIVSSSIVVFAVRKGNPKNIQAWDDLIQPGVEIVTPNPASSGAARWNALAAWGQVSANGGTERRPREYLTKLFANVVALPGSGRDATTAFIGGTGDVLHRLRERGDPRPPERRGASTASSPKTTMLIENPGAILKNADPKAQAWLDFVLSDEGQRQFALKGFRPIIDGVDTTGVKGANDPANPFPTPENLLTVDEGLRELVRAVEEVLRRGERHHHQDHRRVREGRSDPVALTGSRRARPVAPPARAGGAGGGLTRGVRRSASASR